MERLVVCCKACGVELVSHPSQTRCCGCSNLTTVTGEQISANNLSLVVLMNAEKIVKKSQLLSDADLKYQEDRRKRKVRKLYYEER
tara:strand:- start:1038 stop:1295 length:258 start_codon:yes stop_codon:yes gene_type:complete